MVSFRIVRGPSRLGPAGGCRRLAGGDPYAEDGATAMRTLSNSIDAVLDKALASEALSREDGYRLVAADGPAETTALLIAASALNDRARPERRVTYSRKVFLPLTNLCRDRCGYCVFVKGPRQRGAHTMTLDEVVAVARRGAELGCKEALLSLGDHPEARHPEMRETLRAMGFRSTPEYAAAMSKLVLEETGLLPHVNCGTLDREEAAALARWNASLGIMLESASLRLHEPGGPHHGTATKRPDQRLATIAAAAEAGAAVTTGILIGIGETREERADALLAIREAQERCGNVQEVIVQNFRAKAGTRMRGAPEPSMLEMMRTLAAARLLLGPEMNIQAPPNLQADGFEAYLLCGINDWGGVSPLTKDFINPEAAWPQTARLRRLTEEAGFELRERTALYPSHVLSGAWARSPEAASRLAELTDGEGYVKRELEQWS